MTTILIARHGNTFDSGDKVVRLGLTDLPLSTSGKQQAVKLGMYFKANATPLSAVFTSCLRRTIDTANIALQTAGISVPVQQNNIFNEIDYGPDEGKTDQEVIARIGQPALKAWDSEALVPPGWLVDPQLIIKHWQEFAQQIATDFAKQTVLVVTSNGIARFAPYLTGDFENFSKQYNIKLATGGLASISNNGQGWEIDFWNKTT